METGGGGLVVVSALASIRDARSPDTMATLSALLAGAQRATAGGLRQRQRQRH
jgi:hypothetical protein